MKPMDDVCGLEQNQANRFGVLVAVVSVVLLRLGLLLGTRAWANDSHTDRTIRLFNLLNIIRHLTFMFIYAKCLEYLNIQMAMMMMMTMVGAIGCRQEEGERLFGGVDATMAS